MATRKDARATLPVVSDGDIRLLIGERSFDRAREYFRAGKISGLRVQGRALRGRSEGSEGNTYEVSVRFDATGVTETACTCPMEAYCKHVGAVLLAWAHARGRAPGAEAFEVSLARRSREELIAIIERMVALHPELESLASPASSRERRGASTDWGATVALAMRDVGNDWGASRSAAGALLRIVEQAQRAPSRSQRDAVEACRAVIDAALAARRNGLESEGELLGPVIEAARVLRERLAEMKAGDKMRAPIVETLLDVAIGDIIEGGLGYSDEARDALDESADKVERLQITERIQEVIPRASAWGREVLGGWLLSLEADELDHATYLARCRELGLKRQLIERLLDLERAEEALREVQRFEEPELIASADLLVQRRRGDAAEQIVCDRYRQTRSRRLREWLRARLTQRGDVAGVLDLALDAFREQPRLEAYRDVRALAKKVARWDELRDELRAALAKDREATIRVLLEEGEHDAALASFDAMTSKTPRGAWGGGPYGGEFELEVAASVEATHPARAREIYLRRAEALIELRNRAAYRQSCELLVRAKALTGDDEWREYVASLRAISDAESLSRGARASGRAPSTGCGDRAPYAASPVSRLIRCVLVTPRIGCTALVGTIHRIPRCSGASSYIGPRGV